MRANQIQQLNRTPKIDWSSPLEKIDPSLASVADVPGR
jgi:hypothetical protein